MSSKHKAARPPNETETWIDTPPSSPHKMTKAEVAEALGITPQMLYVIFRERTSNRERAQKLAEIYGKPINRFLRPTRTRGRPRTSLPFPFIDFCREAAEMSEFESVSPNPTVARLYYRFRFATQKEIECLADLVTWMREADDKVSIRELPIIWREFQKWRVEQVAIALTEIIDNGDSLSDDAMRWLLNLVGRLQRDYEWHRARFD